MVYDLIIIGGGPAGLTAGIYGARKKLKLLILTEKESWQVVSAINIENYPGFKSILGTELLKKMREQVEDLGVKIKVEKVEKVEKTEEGFKIITKGGEYQTRTLILASGKIPKRLNIPGEKEFTGKGVSYCVTCDGPVFSGKEVAVIGAGNAGLGAALEMTKYARKIYVLEFLEKIIGDEITQEKLRNSEKVEFIFPVEIKEIKGNDFVNALIYKDRKDGKLRQLKVEGVFVEIGSIPASDFIQDLTDLNQKGEIIIDPKTNQTRTPGLFAAGDVTDIPYKQIIIACGEGAKAALSVYKYLSKKE